jgi:hypothetical protein
MPNRYLREGIRESETFARLSWQAKMTYILLIVSVDDFGRCEASERLLRPKLFPFNIESVREADLSRWLQECEQAGLVRRYAAEGKYYLQMFKWEKGRAIKSKCPESSEIVSECLQPYTNANYGLQMSPTPTPTPIPIPIPTPDEHPPPSGVLLTPELPLSASFPPALDSDDFEAAWGNWIAYRKERHLAKLKPRSVDAQLARLADLGEAEAIKAINESIAQGYQGIFPAGEKQGKNYRAAFAD